MPTPHRMQIRDVVEGMLGRAVTVGDVSEPLSPTDLPKPAVAAYVDDSGRTSAVAIVDFPLVAHAGAAMALIPVGGAEAAIEEQVMPTNLMENTAELLNVLASSIGDASGFHQRLERTFGPHDTLPPEVARLAASVGARDDVVVDIAGYGSGRLAIVSAMI